MSKQYVPTSATAVVERLKEQGASDNQIARIVHRHTGTDTGAVRKLLRNWE